MSTRKQRTLLVAVATVLLSLGLVVGLRPSGGARGEAIGEEAAPPGPLADVGRFKLGFNLGVERSGFSGMPRFMVFLSAADPNRALIETWLDDLELLGELDGFTPILVDALSAEEQHVEEKLRREGAQVVIRSMTGKLLAVLRTGFNLAELQEAVQGARRSQTVPPAPSPVLVLLRENGCSRGITPLRRNLRRPDDLHVS